jgi:hypothetical protein
MGLLALLGFFALSVSDQATQQMSHAGRDRWMALDLLLKTEKFIGWDGHVKPEALAASRSVYQRTLKRLMLAGPNRPETTYVQILDSYIAQFNRLDKKYRYIHTIEREEICEEIEQVMSILELEGYEECDDLSVARDW